MGAFPSAIIGDEEILDGKRVGELEEEIMTAVDQAKRENMVLDFSNVRLMTSSFQGLLVKVHKRICGRGAYLKLWHIDPNIRKVFKITGLTKILDIS